MTMPAQPPTSQPPVPQPPSKPVRPPRDYLRGPWPDGPVRHLSTDEGGEAVERMAEQAARLASQIRLCRAERGLRRSQLAARTGLRPNTVTDVEEGLTWPDLRTLCLIAWALDADLELEPRVALRARAPMSRAQPPPAPRRAQPGMPPPG